MQFTFVQTLPYPLVIKSENNAHHAVNFNQPHTEYLETNKWIYWQVFGLI